MNFHCLLGLLCILTRNKEKGKSGSRLDKIYKLPNTNEKQKLTPKKALWYPLSKIRPWKCVNIKCREPIILGLLLEKIKGGDPKRYVSANIALVFFEKKG